MVHTSPSKLPARELIARDYLLEVAAEATRAVISIEPFEEAIRTALALLGEGLRTDRVQILEQRDDATGLSPGWVETRYEWRRNEVISQLHHHSLCRISYEGMEEWYERFRAGETLGMLVEDMPEPFRTTQVLLGVCGTYAVPILLRGRFWGILGVDDCHPRGLRDSAELAVLKLVAVTLGAAIDRDRARERLSLAENATREAEMQAARQRVEYLATANQVLQRRDCLLATVANVSRQLLEAVDVFAALPTCLKEVGESAGMSRVQLFLRRDASAGVGVRQAIVS